MKNLPDGFLKNLRINKGLLPEDVCGGLIYTNTYLKIEDNSVSGDTCLLRILLGRLHIPDTAFTFFLSNKEKYLFKLEEDILTNIALKKWNIAESLFAEYDLLSDKSNKFQMLFYYRLLFLLARDKKTLSKHALELTNTKLPVLADNLYKRVINKNPLSQIELGFLTEYYNYTVNDSEMRANIYFTLIKYCHENFIEAKDFCSFYASLNFYYSKYLYQEQDYYGCIQYCRKGLEVTKTTKRIFFTLDLYSLCNQSIDCLLNQVDMPLSKKQELEAERENNNIICNALRDVYFTE